MGFETVTGTTSKSLKDLADGAAITGYLKGILPEEGKFGTQYNFSMVNNETGEEFKLYPAGTAKYVAQNIAQHLGLAKFEKAKPENVANDAKLVGYLVRITKTGSYIQKATGKQISTFEFARDPDKKLF